MSLYPVTILLTLITLVIGMMALWHLAEGTFQRRKLAARSALVEVERRSNTPKAKLESRLRQYDIGKRIDNRLARSGVHVSLGVFVMAMVVTGILAVVFVWHALAPLLGIAAIVGVGFGFFGYLKRQEERRRQEFTAQLPELARVLSNATQAGLALPTAMDMAADELDDPAGYELRLVARSMHIGQPFEEAVSSLRERMPSREIGVLISTLLVSSRSGGALVSALRNISDTLESRKETRREVGTILTETTATAWALLAMGGGSLLLINVLRPGTVREMTESILGLGVLTVGISLFVIGFVFVRRMTKIDY